MFQQLLVAIDGTDRTEVTLSFAMSIAQQCGSTVRLCFVNAFQVGSRGVPLLSDDEATNLVIDALRQLRAEGIDSSGCVHRAHYRHVADRIVSAADAMAADAIILGSPRPRRLGRPLSSGVAARTTRLTPLPVVMAPAPLDLPTVAPFDVLEIVTAQREREQSLPPL